ncbi:DUF1427 family protein [Salibacterium salarium]|uniref:DUF1427 family protein n=1 Tax=Salibacterium salarium TaxID=284579 RepID=A0A3R9P7E6_9BACI|nr:DUF1427 family protein [Salibacterium salarium]RSL31926.1 DUF1427 family protein [Salibacterium salarium]
MKDLFLSLVAGIVIGVVFKFLRLPLPAPPVLAGVLGVAGVYFGGIIVDWLYKTLT